MKRPFRHSLESSETRERFGIRLSLLVIMAVLCMLLNPLTALAAPTLRTDCPNYQNPTPGTAIDTTTSGNWFDPLQSYGTCAYILPGYKLPITQCQIPIVNDATGDPADCLNGNYTGSVTLDQSDCRQLQIGGQTVSYRVRRCDIGLPPGFSARILSNGQLMGDKALVWSWLLNGTASNIPQNPGSCGVSGRTASTYDDAAEVGYQNPSTLAPPSGLCIDLQLPTLPGTWRLSAYELDYDNGGVAPYPPRTEILSLFPYGNLSTPIANSQVTVGNFVNPGKYVSWVLNSLQPVTLKVIANTTTTPRTLNSILSGLFIDKLDETTCALTLNCGGPGSLQIVKKTNGIIASTPTSPDIPVLSPGAPVTWTYEVKNNGNVTLFNVMVTDNQLPTSSISCPQDPNSPTNPAPYIISQLTPGQMVTCTATGTAQNVGSSPVQGLCGGQPNRPLYENMGTATGTTAAGAQATATATSHYCNPPQNPAISLVKYTLGGNVTTPPGADADLANSGDAPIIPVGGTVIWTYRVKNVGNVALTNVTVTDNQPGVTAAIRCAPNNTNIIPTLAVGATVDCTATGQAVNLLTNTTVTKEPGLCGQYPNTPLYFNTGTVVGTPPSGPAVTASNPSHYCNPQTPAIGIIKFTNGVDADDPNAGDAPQIEPGGPVTWTYKVTNTGNVTLVNVAVTDDQLVSATAISCPGANPSSLNVIPSLPVGGSVTCTASGTAVSLVYPSTNPTTVLGKCGSVTNPSSPLYENKGTATGYTLSTPPQTVVATNPSHYCNPLPGSYTLTKNPKNATYNIGQNISFTLVVASTGPGTAKNVVLTDPLPTLGNLNSWIITSNPGGCNIAADNKTLVCLFGDLANGQTRTVTVATTAAGGADATACPGGVKLNNTAIVTGIGLPTLIDTGDYTCTPPVGNYTLTKTPKNATYNIGDNISFQMVVTSTGPGTAKNVVLNDPLPTQGNLNSWTITSNPGGCTPLRQHLNCSYGDLANGDVEIGDGDDQLPRADATACTGVKLNNVATITGTGLPNKTDTGDYTCTLPGITLTKTPKNATYNLGDNISFQMVVTSTGPATAKNVVLSDPLPTLGNLNSWTIASGGNPGGCSIAANTLNCSFGDLASGQTRTVTVTTNVAGGANATACPGGVKLNNTATVTSTGLPTKTDTGDYTCTPPGITLTKTPKNASYNLGDNISFQMVVTSTGPGTAKNVVLSDLLPTLGNLNSWIITSNPGGCSISGNNLNCSYGDLANGQTRSVTVATNATGGANATACPGGVTLNNTATVTSTGLPPKTDTGDYTCTPPGSLTLTKTPKGATYNLGDNISFQMVVTSTGPGTAKNVVLSDPLPTLGNLNSWTIVSSPGGCSIASNTLTCSFGDLANQQTRSVTVATNVVGGANLTACPGGVTLNNTATVTSNGLPPKTDTGDYTCTPPPGSFTVTKTPKNATYNIGQNINFTMEVKSTGPGTAKNVVLNDPLPTLGNLNSWIITSNPGNGCTIVANTLTCSFGDLANQQTRSVTVATNASGGANATACPGGVKLNNTATVTSTGLPTKTDTGDYLCTPSVCDLTVEKTCQIPPPPPTTTFTCSTDITSISMIWNGSQTVNVQAYYGKVGASTLLKTINGVKVGDEVTVSGYANSGNNVEWEIFSAATGQSLGKSTFHLSCSDGDMDGEISNRDQQQLPGVTNDCGKNEGNGKGLTGFINTWLFAGMVDSNETLDCTPTPTTPSEACTLTPTGTPSCETLNAKPKELTFQYTGGGCSKSNNNQAAGKAVCTPSPAGSVISGPITVLYAGGNSDLNKDRYTVVPTTVNPDGSFTISFNGSDLKSDSYINMCNSTGVCELNKIHTSCSQPLAVGNVFGSLTLVGFNGQTAGNNVTYGYKVTNNGDLVNNISLVDNKLGAISSQPFSLAKGASQTFSKAASLTATTTNTATASGTLVSGAACSASDSVTVTVQGLPSAPFVCSDAKPITSMVVKWNGTQNPIYVKMWNGSVGTGTPTLVGPTAPGQNVTFTRTTASTPNDINFQIYTDSAYTQLLGISTFHLSCSDVDMDGSEDCGKAAGNGKTTSTSFINTWLFEGMGGNGLTLTCP